MGTGRWSGRAAASPSAHRPTSLLPPYLNRGTGCRDLDPLPEHLRQYERSGAADCAVLPRPLDGEAVASLLNPGRHLPTGALSGNGRQWLSLCDETLLG